MDIRRIFSLRGAVMKTVPKFLFGPFRNALKLCVGGADRRSPRQGSGTSGERMEVVDVISASLVAQIPKRKLVERFEKFSRGEWNDMFLESAVCDEKAAAMSRR